MIETTDDRRALFGDDPDLALFADIPDAVDENGDAEVIVSRNVPGLFDRAYRESNGREGYRPCFLCLDEDAQFVKQFHRIMLAGQVFQITERQPDGTGFTQMVLRSIGVYRIDDEEGSDAGFPYVFPIVFGDGSSLDDVGGTIDENNPRLHYPYTIKTYLDLSTKAARL